jgi:hypothetical protein
VQQEFVGPSPHGGGRARAEGRDRRHPPGRVLVGTSMNGVRIRPAAAPQALFTDPVAEGAKRQPVPDIGDLAVVDLLGRRRLVAAARCQECGQRPLAQLLTRSPA